MRIPRDRRGFPQGQGPGLGFPSKVTGAGSPKSTRGQQGRMQEGSPLLVVVVLWQPPLLVTKRMGQFLGTALQSTSEAPG